MRVPATLTFQGAVPALRLARAARLDAPVAIKLDPLGLPSRLYIEGRDVGKVSAWPEVVGHEVWAGDDFPREFITERTIINVVLDLPCPRSASPGGLSAQAGLVQKTLSGRALGATGALGANE